MPIDPDSTADEVEIQSGLDDTGTGALARAELDRETSDGCPPPAVWSERLHAADGRLAAGVQVVLRGRRADLRQFYVHPDRDLERTAHLLLSGAEVAAANAGADRIAGRSASAYLQAVFRARGYREAARLEGGSFAKIIYELRL